MTTGPGADPYGAELVLGDPPALLRIFNRAGVLAPADVHLAVRLMALAGESDESVALAAALAGRAPRVGHVSVDLEAVRASVVVAESGLDLDELPWPDPPAWLEAVCCSGLVAWHGPAGTADAVRPLHLAGTHLYLDRYWRDETDVAAELLLRAGAGAPGPAPVLERLEALFPGSAAADQRRAAATAGVGRLTVIAGGPGTGKTTTVARLLALLAEQAVSAGTRLPLIGLAAPTGKAAARMEEAVRVEVATLPIAPAARQQLEALSGITLHRLLGSRPDRSSRFRHHSGHRLPHDVVVVDEASMVSLALMGRLLEAVRPDARLVLVGDPEQLVSVEAGAVLADIVGPDGAGAGPGEAGTGPGGAGSLAPRIAVLRTNHRFAGPLAELAAAVRSGDADRTVAVLASGYPSLRWVPDVAAEEATLERRLSDWAVGLVAVARAGDVRSALAAMAAHRLLCAHRDGPAGAKSWNGRIEEWVALRLPGGGLAGGWYAGRPVMVTANDYSLRLFNGDTGVVIPAPFEEAPGGDAATGPGPAQPAPGRLAVAFEAAGGRLRTVSPYRLASAETVYATTVHKSQGSEYDRVTLILPPETSRLLTRELLYTAVTRARREVLVCGGEAAVRHAVERPLGRASGLAERLWGR